MLYLYSRVRDREIAALVAASLAYGRVTQIVCSAHRVLDPLGRRPHRTLLLAQPADLRRMLSGFKHRFTTAADIVHLLLAIRGVLQRHGSINACFLAGMNRNDRTVEPALRRFAAKIAGPNRFLIPRPESGGAFKRLNLYLRWMVRSDAVDPGGWRGIRPDQLIVPLDTHMARIGQTWRLTRRKTPDMRMALEITESFRKWNPADPVKYDFALTRFGIRGLSPRLVPVSRKNCLRQLIQR